MLCAGSWSFLVEEHGKVQALRPLCSGCSGSRKEMRLGVGRVGGSLECRDVPDLCTLALVLEFIPKLLFKGNLAGPWQL